MADIRRLPGPVTDRWDWQLRGACRGEDSALFFHPEGERGSARTNRERNAKLICRRCPVLTECLRYSLTTREPYGVWGGLSETERTELLTENRTADRQAVGARGPVERGGSERVAPGRGSLVAS